MRTNNRMFRNTVLLVVPVLSAGALCGCHSDNATPLSTAQTQSADRLAQISKQSGGDWDKVSQDDRDYIMKNLAYGNERTARMLIAPPPGKGGAGAPPGMPGGAMGSPPNGTPSK